MSRVEPGSLPARSTTRRSASAGVLFTCLLVGACNGEQETSSAGEQRARGAVVAVVNGAEIGVSEVRELAEATGLSPLEALRRLEEAQLLDQRAAQLGFAAGAAVAREAKRARVQALLARTVESEVRPEQIAMEQVRERFTQVGTARGLSDDTFPQHEPAIREQLALEMREAALAALVAKLKGSANIQLDEAEVQRLLSDPSLWGGEP